MAKAHHAHKTQEQTSLEEKTVTVLEGDVDLEITIRRENWLRLVVITRLMGEPFAHHVAGALLDYYMDNHTDQDIEATLRRIIVDEVPQA